MTQRPGNEINPPSKKVGFFDVSGGVTVTAVSVFVVKAALSQLQLIFRNGLFPTERVESDGAVGLFVFCSYRKNFFFFTVIHTDFKTKIYTKKRHVYYKAGFLVSIQSL